MGHTLQQRKRTTLPTIGWRSMVASVVATFAMDEADARRLEEGLWITAEPRKREVVHRVGQVVTPSSGRSVHRRR